MKKLMFIATAALCGAVTAEEITSANVVGYAQNGLQYGSTMVAPQFLNIGTDAGAVELQSLKCRYDDSDSVVLNLLDDIGLVTASYNWVNWGGESGEEECWIDADTMAKPETPVYFQPGSALWIQGDSSDNLVQSAGEVGTDDVVVTLQYGSTACGNCTPVEINLQDMFCRYDDSDSVVLNLLDDIGLVTASYNWVNWGGESGEEECWIDADTMAKPETPVIFQAGQGFWVQGDSSDNLLTIPGVEL